MAEFAAAPLFVFCLILTGTPGPNNMINLAQGVRVGFLRAWPFALGVGLGLAVMLVLAALGLGAALESSPTLLMVMKAATFCFLTFLAWKLLTAGPLKASDQTESIGFWGGFLFQWVNPKSWFAVLSIAATYLPPTPDIGVAVAAGLVFATASQLTQPVWIVFGGVLRRYLARPEFARAFNWTMAALLLATTLPALLGFL